MTPKTQSEVLLAIPILIVSSIMNGLIIGNMALYISELQKKASEFQRKMDSVNTAMNNLDLSQELRREVNEYFITTNSTSSLQTELNDFMSKRISQKYRTICSIQIFKSMIKTNSITKKLLIIEERVEQTISNIVKRMEVVLKSPESIIIEQNDEVEFDDAEIYLIAKGKCEVRIKDKFDDRYSEKLVRDLAEDEHFGEIAMIYPGVKRSASVKVKKDSYLTSAKISRQSFIELL